jgi:hypothetical protein
LISVWYGIYTQHNYLERCAMLFSVNIGLSGADKVADISASDTAEESATYEYTMAEQNGKSPRNGGEN